MGEHAPTQADGAAMNRSPCWGFKTDAWQVWPIIPSPLPLRNVSRERGKGVGGQLSVLYQFYPIWHVSWLSCKNGLTSKEGNEPMLASVRTCKNQWCSDKPASTADICSASSSSLSSAERTTRKTSLTNAVCSGVRWFENTGKLITYLWWRGALTWKSCSSDSNQEHLKQWRRLQMLNVR